MADYLLRAPVETAAEESEDTIRSESKATQTETMLGTEASKPPYEGVTLAITRAQSKQNRTCNESERAIAESEQTMQLIPRGKEANHEEAITLSI